MGRKIIAIQLGRTNNDKKLEDFWYDDDLMWNGCTGVRRKAHQ